MDSADLSATCPGHRHRCGRRLARTAAAVSLVFFGCSSVPFEASVPPARPLGREIPAYRAPADPAALAPQAAAYKEPTGVVTLRDALAAALVNNPDLATFSWEARVREAETLQAGLFPNPELGFELENFAGSGDAAGVDESEATIVLGQLVELGGKRAKRRRVARLEQELAGWDYEARRMDVLTEVTQAFASVLAAQDRLVLADELVRLAEESTATVTAQVRAGAASPVEQTRAQVALATSRVDRARITSDLAVARSRMAAVWGSRSPLFERVEGDLEQVASVPPVEELISRIDQNPDLARWTKEIEQRRAVVELEDARRIPNVTVEGGLRRLKETNDNAFVFGVTVPIPVMDRNQGSRQAARYALLRAEHERRSAEVRTYSELSITHRELTASLSELRALQSEVLPQAEAAYERTSDAYQRGLFRYLDVLDAQRTLFEVRGRYLDALESYHRVAAAVERLTGEPLAGRR